MNYTLIIPGKLAGLNEYTKACRTNPFKGNALKKTNQTICKAYIKSKMRGVHISEPVVLHFRWYEGNKRRDHDNVSSFGRKVIQDALVDCGVLKDDGWDYVYGFTDSFFVDAKNPRIEVGIEVLNAE